MKIKSVDIENIASFEKANISFDKQPLKDTDLFLITGPTGSGKTTLLDAITLALYAKTPRVDKSPGGTQHANSDTLTGTDPRNLMRMNTGYAHSQVYFTGNDGKEYCATWSVERGTRQNPKSRMSNYLWTIKNLSDGTETVGTNNRNYDEVGKVIIDAIGLDFNQFCRTTMLAQGEFTQFLKSDEKGKADILEKISGSDIYSRIGAEIYRLSAEAEKNYKEEKSLHESIVVLSPQERAAKEMERGAKVAEMEGVKKESGEVLKRIGWEKDFAKAVKEEGEAKDAVEVARGQVESEEFLAKEREYQEWNATIEVRGQVALFVQEQTKVEDASAKLAAMESGYRDAVAGYLFEKQLLDDKFGEKAALEQELAAQQQNASAYGNAQTIVAKIEGIVKSAGQVAEKVKGLKVCKEKRLPEAQDALSGFREEFKKAREQEIEAKRAEEELDGKVKALGIDRLRGEKEFLMELKREVSTVSTLEQELALAKDAYSSQQAKIAPSEELVAKEKEELVRLEGEHERRMQSVTDAVKDMRARLAKALGAEDNTCPVCGQLVVSLQDDAILDAEAEKAEKERDAQKQKCKDAESEFAKLEASVKVLADNVAQKGRQLADAQSKLAAKVDGREDKEQLMGMSQEKLQEGIESIAAEIVKGEELEKELKRLSGVYRDAVEAASAKKTEVVKAEETEKSVRNDIARLEKERQELEEAIACAQKEIGALLEGSCGWSADWNVDTEGFVKEIKAKAKNYDAKRQGVADIAAAIGKMEPVIGHVADAQNRVMESMPQWKGDGVGPEMVKNLEEVWLALERNVNALLKVISLSGEEAEKNRVAVEAFLAGNAGYGWERLKALNAISVDQARIAGNMISQKRNDFSVALKRHEDAQKGLEAVLGQRPEGKQESLEVLEEKQNGLFARRDALVTAIALICKELEEDDANMLKKGDTSRLDALKAEAEKWGAFSKLYGDKEGTTLKKIAQSFILESLLNTANHHLQNMAPRYRLLVVPGSLELKLEDKYNGFSTRSTNTISGGESFLVSLSLALALADFGQHLGVSTLFIDEGFGTLSGEPLQNAINTLRSLHSNEGRQVGIISHREELIECIPVQIKVNLPDGSSAAKVEV